MAGTICKNCGAMETSVRNTSSAFWFALWWILTLVSAFSNKYLALAFGTVALLNTLFYLFRWGKRCAKCQSTQLISTDTPIGKKLFQDYHQQ